MMTSPATALSIFDCSAEIDVTVDVAARRGEPASTKAATTDAACRTGRAAGRPRSNPWQVNMSLLPFLSARNAVQEDARRWSGRCDTLRRRCAVHVFTKM